ncbi:unnamed protein product [Lota lota]
MGDMSGMLTPGERPMTLVEEEEDEEDEDEEEEEEEERVVEEEEVGGGTQEELRMESAPLRVPEELLYLLAMCLR